MLKKIMKCTTRCYIVNKGVEKLPSHLLSALPFFYCRYIFFAFYFDDEMFGCQILPYCTSNLFDHFVYPIGLKNVM